MSAGPNFSKDQTVTYFTKPHTSLLTVATTVLVSGLVLSGCSVPAPDGASLSSSPQISESEFLAAHDLTGLGAVQIIDRLDSMSLADRPTDLLASVQPEKLVLTDGQNRETHLPMPQDEVYVSVAPYREQTHDCYFHSLTTCVGELGNAEILVTLTDADGNVLIDGAYETYDNGFVGLWVPRDVEATLIIEQDGQIGSVTISTINEDDPTCVTTLRLT